MTLKGYLTMAAVLEREHFDFDDKKHDEEIATLRSELMEDIIRDNTLNIKEKMCVLSVMMYGEKGDPNDEK